MNSDTKDNIAVVLAIALIILTIVGLWYAIANNLLGDIIVIIGLVLLAIFAIFMVLYVVLGAFYMVKQRDKVDTTYSSSLDDIQEVDREMNKDDKH